ncbi:beta family protein [Modestobacter roseus]|uniref:T4 beta protein n=1 Tax=Modestobacter roseus TaxID=1181884 RepID=A0A562ILS4_9ACTN|nr:beta family protein [Modestobacter roseus]MQA35940.1 hypothetical protein [Modestobacter roseus]TWH71848.1 T4 beta protein [Modestobacter roseus]
MVATGAVDSTSYVAILKCKQAELHAVAATVSPNLVPLFEVRDPEANARSIVRAWQLSGQDIWVHPLNLDGFDPTTWVGKISNAFSLLRSGNVSAVPVVTIDDDAGVLSTMATVAATDSRGVVLRLEAEDVLTTSAAGLAAEVSGVMSALSVTESEVDLVLDVGLVRDSTASRIATAESALRSVPNLTGWRSCTVAFSAFPESVGDVVQKNSVVQVARNDAQAYRALVARGPGRELTYGDYAVGVPTYADIAWSPIPSIRYTTDDTWAVHRAESRTNPSPQYVALAGDLVREPYFRGSGYSSGDAYLEAVASGVDGPGNATTYLRSAISHHLAVVLDRLATHGVP